MPYKHKETEELYDISGGHEMNGSISYIFRPWNKMLEDITITHTYEKCKALDDMDSAASKDERDGLYQIYKNESKKQREIFDKLVKQIFEYVTLNPDIKLVKPTLVKFKVEMNCPLYGAPLEWDHLTLLSYPAQYNHKCSNPKCNYHTCLSHWHVDQELLTSSKEEAYRIITSGTFEEKNALADLSNN